MATEITNGQPQTVNAIRAALLAAGIDPKGSRNKSALAKRLAKATAAPEKLAPLAPKERAKMIARRPKKKIPREAKKVAAAKPHRMIGDNADRAKVADAAIKKLTAKGLSLRAICAALEADKIPTPMGGKSWLPSSVQAAIKRIG